LQRLSEWWI